jgi:hypothetical protein
MFAEHTVMIIFALDRDATIWMQTVFKKILSHGLSFGSACEQNPSPFTECVLKYLHEYSHCFNQGRFFM